MSYLHLQKVWPLAFSITAHVVVIAWAVGVYTSPKLLHSSTEYITVRLVELQTHKIVPTQQVPMAKTIVKTAPTNPATPAVIESTVPATEPINTQVAEVKPAKTIEEYTPPSFSAEYLHNPAPEYPPMAKRRGEQGRVLLRVTVSETGEATVVLVSQSSGYALLDQSALHAVRNWQFVPARFNNHAVTAEVTVPVRFTLES
jgi:periplasmic protein TonB